MKNLMKPRTIIAFMFYGTFIYLVVTGKDIPQELVLMVGSIQGFYFGKKVADARRV